MLKRTGLVAGICRAALAAGLVGWATPALAADTDVAVEEVVVTGSYIRGAAEDAAMPVDVISAEDLGKQGRPSTVDLIKALPTIGANFAGDVNLTGGGRTEGMSSVNLRGLTDLRTLVLLNGRRQVPWTSSRTFVDLNMFPRAAIGRIEILKNGAAATYGSDAIAGVVNFITRKDFDGLELGATYSAIADSDGDYTASLLWGHTTDRWNVLVSADYQNRGQLRMIDRDFTQLPYNRNPQSWTAASNPGNYTVGAGPSATGALTFVDPGCRDSGGVLSDTALVGTSQACYTPFILFQDLVEEQESFQLYGEFNFDLTDTTKFHIEALYSQTDTPRLSEVPSFNTTKFPTTVSNPAGAGVITGRYFIPAANPGLQALLAQYPGFLTGTALTQAQTLGVNTTTGNWRPVGVGGDPESGFEKLHSRVIDTYRISADLAGTTPFGVDWDLALTYGQAKNVDTNTEQSASRLQYALRGLGGPGCTPGGANPATSTPGVGPCLWFNPFSTSIRANALTGQTNPHFVASTVNSPELWRWMNLDNVLNYTNKLFVVDGVLNGKTGLALPGGDVAWAAGFQYRLFATKSAVSPYQDVRITPCIDEGAPLSSCPTAPFGPFLFFNSVAPVDYDQEVNSLFAEVSLPITDAFQAQVAVRHERHDAGETTIPKLSLRWQVTDAIAFRASAGKTYRAPTLIQVDPNLIVTGVNLFNLFRTPFDVQGNADLRPETATDYSVGVIFNGFDGRIRATVDYWNYRLKDQLVTENGPAILSAVFPTLPSGAPNNCTNPAFAPLVARITFAGGVCAVGNILRTRGFNINGPEVKTSGVDATFNIDLGEVFGGELTAGAEGAYNFEYKTGNAVTAGLVTVPAFDAVGKYNFGVDPRSFPQWRGSAFLDYHRGQHNLRGVVRYIDGLRDMRGLLAISGFPSLGTNTPEGAHIAAFSTYDLYYQFKRDDGLSLSASVMNLFDKDPPFAQMDINYDAFTANPLGRVIKVGVTKSF